MKKQFITTIAALGILAVSYSGQASANELTYAVKSGDSLSKIASTHHLSVQQLMQFNHLSSSTIYVGEQLSLFAPAPEMSTYTVKSGDSLSLIAKLHNTTVTELKSLNNLSSDIVKIGQVLKVPTTTFSSYTVKSGDSLSLIAKLHNTTVAKIKSMNGLSIDTLQIGQVLKVPGTLAPSPKVKFNADALITEAKKYIGVKYVWGGSTPSGFDCSGFINFIFAKQGVSIPRTVAAMWKTAAAASAPQKGDIVFFDTLGGGPSHAGIYIGNNQFIHAGSSTGVTIADMTNSYWKSRYLGAKSVK